MKKQPTFLITVFLIFVVFINKTSFGETIKFNYNSARSYKKQIFFTNMNTSSSNIWIVAVGVCENSNPKDNLTEPCNSANAVWNYFYNYDDNAIPQNHLIRLTHKEATKSNILSNLKQVCGQLTTNDVLYFYIDCHGLSDGSGFLTYDNYLYFSELNDIFKNSNAKLIVCFANACYSGKYLVPDNISFAILAASPGIAWGNQFPKHLIDGLEGNANSNDNVLTLKEIFDYLFIKLKGETQSQTPVIKYSNYNPNTTLLYVK